MQQSMRGGGRRHHHHHRHQDEERWRHGSDPRRQREPDPQGFYKALDVAPTANATEIKTAFRQLALVHRPDKNPHSVEESTEKFRELRAAFDVVGDEEQRLRYDKGMLGEPGGFGNVNTQRGNCVQMGGLTMCL